MLEKLRQRLNKISCSCRLLSLLVVCALTTLQVSARPMRRDHFLIRQQTFTYNIARLIEYIYSKGYKCTLGETFRTPAQAAIYAASGKGIADSNHCYRLAMDINLFNPTDKYLHDVKDYLLFGEYWEKLNPWNEWGGRFRNGKGQLIGDYNHFEMD